MSVTEVNQALGSWSLKLSPGTPRTITDALAYYGHLAITPGREDPRVAGDSLLESARYVGPMRGKTFSKDGVHLSGAGMAFWLGDEDNKGAVYETAVELTSSSFTNAIRQLLPGAGVGGAITEGTLHTVAGSYTGRHQFQSPRQAINYVVGLFDADWRVNGNGTLDAGLPEDLYDADPKTAIVRRVSGTDMTLRALPGNATLDSDVEDFTTKVLLIAESDGTSVSTGSATINPALNVYFDIHGNPLNLTRLVSESGTSSTNATARAQLQLNRFTSPRDALKLNSNTHDIRGDVEVGDYVWVHDDDAGLYDENNEIIFKGDRLNPVKLRVFELTWPVEKGMGVYFRTPSGQWIDLTDYAVFESGQTNVVVGGYNRSLTNSGSEPIGRLPQADSSVPNAPAWVTPFNQAVYQSATTGMTRAQVLLAWARPTNTDDSAIVDGHHYEIQYRTSATPIFPATHAQMSGRTHTQLATGTHDQPITFVTGNWESTSVGFDFTNFMLRDLTPGLPYEFRIRGVDAANPPNFGDWSTTTAIQTNEDTIAPSTPASPTVAASRIAIQVKHMLGMASGGTFNLESDLNHLEIHGEYEPLFTTVSLPPSEGGTLLGKLQANIGNLIGHIPVVGTFQVENTEEMFIKVIAVDDYGNKSSASVAVSVTAELIDDAHISDLTVSKVTAGVVLANWIQGADFRTANSGARSGFYTEGFYSVNANNEVTFSTAGGGLYARGNFQLGPDIGPKVTLDTDDSTLRLYPLADSDQRIRIRAYTVDQPDDLVDAPGLRIESFNENINLDGAFLSLSEDSWYLGLNTSPVDSAVESHVYGSRDLLSFGFSPTSTTAGRVGMQIQASDGAWFTFGQLAGGTTSGDQLFHGGTGSSGPGFSGVVFNYSATMRGDTGPLYGILNNLGTTFEHALGASNSTGWAIGWNDSANTHYFAYMIVRV